MRTGTSTDERAVLDVLDELVRAWNEDDADGYGALFTPDADYVTFMGTRYRGSTEIAESHRALWQVAKHSRMFARIESVRFVTPDVAVVISHGEVGHKPPRQLTKVQTYTIVRTPDGWRIAAFHNTRRKPMLERLSFRFAPGTRPWIGPGARPGVAA